MGKHFVPIVMGLAAGIAGLAYHGDMEGAGPIIDNGFNFGDKKTVIEVGAPSTHIDHLAAFAVGQISGSITVDGHYNQVRFGPLPNCEVDISMTLPFVAEPIIQLKNLDVTTGTPDAAGKFDVNVVVNGNVEVLNPRTLLYKPEVHLDQGWTNMCDDAPYENLINTMWNIGGLATDTAAQCMVDTVNTQNVTDAAGNKLETDASAAIHKIYDDDLRIDLQALYPNAKSFNIAYPDADPNFDVTKTKSYQALAAAVENTQNDKYKVNADALKTCTFESLQLDVATTVGQ